MDTARSYDSYLQTMYAVLDQFKPRHVLEFGTGKSTQVLAMYPSIVHLDSVEHDEQYFKQISDLQLPNTKIHFQPNLDAYACTKTLPQYDFIFVDGRNRSRCLINAKNVTKLVMLHDAEREQYKNAVDEYTFKHWTDEGHTLVLTDSPEINEKLNEALNGVK